MNLMLAFAFGGPEMIFVFLLLLLLFGAKKLPGLARGIGQSLGEFKKARKEFEDEIHLAQDLKDDVSPKPRRNKEVGVSVAPKEDKAPEPASAEPAPAPAAKETEKAGTPVS